MISRNRILVLHEQNGAAVYSAQVFSSTLFVLFSIQFAFEGFFCLVYPYSYTGSLTRCTEIKMLAKIFHQADDLCGIPTNLYIPVQFVNDTIYTE